jgi:hypothetical protein
LIDLPLEELPYVDEHSTDIAATAERTWEGVIAYVAAAGRSRRGRTIAKQLGCQPSETSGDPGQIGSTIPGFTVTRSVEPAVLALVGEHRFARYALIFRIDEFAEGPVRLRAETRAEFPRTQGRIYRALVIGTRGHLLAVRSILRRVRKHAERA